MPAQPLSEEQKADAARLRKAFSEHQAKLRKVGLPWTQEALADQLGFGQSALNQYLNGKIPLNAAALYKFCLVLVVEPASISPAIVAAEQAKAMKWGPGMIQSGLSPDAIELAHQLDAVPKNKHHDAYLAAKAAIEQIMGSSARRRT